MHMSDNSFWQTEAIGLIIRGFYLARQEAARSRNCDYVAMIRTSPANTRKLRMFPDCAAKSVPLLRPSLLLEPASNAAHDQTKRTKRSEY